MIRVRILRSDGGMIDLSERGAAERWFAGPAARRAGDRHVVTCRIGTFEFDGLEWNAPTCASDLFAKALDRIPGNAPFRRRSDWSLLDDFARGHCATLAAALADAFDGEVYACCDRVAEQNAGRLSDLSGFVHAAALLPDGSTVCAAGARPDAASWAAEFVRRPSGGAHGRADTSALETLCPPISPQVAAWIPDVVDLAGRMLVPAPTRTRLAA